METHLRFKFASSLSLNNVKKKMQADISAYLKGLLKTLNPKILKAIIVLIEAGKINPFHFLLLCYPSLKTKKQKKPHKFIYILTSIIALFFPPSIQDTLKTPVPFIENF